MKMQRKVIKEKKIRKEGLGKKLEKRETKMQARGGGGYIFPGTRA